MIKISINSHKKIIAFLLIVTFVSLFAINNSYGIANEGVRDGISWKNRDGNPGNHPFNKTDGYHCSASNIEYGPFGSPDMEWEIDNPTCITYWATVAAASMSARMAANYACNNNKSSALATAAAALGIYASPDLAAEMAQNNTTCAALTAAAAVPGAGAAAASAATACCNLWAMSAVSIGISLAALAVIYGVAEDAFKYARVCGRNWFTWEENDDGVMIYGSLGDWTGDNVARTYSNYNGSYSQYLNDKVALGEMPFEVENREYRELIYGGIEYEGRGNCQNPNWGSDRRKEILGYDSDEQRYYMRGPNQASNYACERFSIATNEDERKAGQIAYECCIEESTKTMCIESSNRVEGESGYEYEFCEIGAARCNVKGVWYEVYEAKDHSNYLCAKAYSVCPYNHLLGGGTETANIYSLQAGDVDYDENKAGAILNHCQYLEHCVKVPGEPYIRNIDMDGEYISSSCFDLIGDSQNDYSYNADLVSINNSHFSAPIAQCFHETLYNIFLYKAGHAKCTNEEEIPDEDGVCPSGNEQFEGDDLEGVSFFETIQQHLKLVIKLVLTGAIMMVGYTILMGGSMIARKDIMMFIIKIGLVSYFALGDAWQTKFFEGVFKGSLVISDIVMRIDESETRIYQIDNGSITTVTVDNIGDIETGDDITISNISEIEQFNDQKFTVGAITENTFTIEDNDEEDIEITKHSFILLDANGNNINSTNYDIYYSGYAEIALTKKLDGCQFPKYNHEDGSTDNPQYPEGSEYLKIWDTLDCKIIYALGFAPGVTVPHLFMFILAGFLTGGAGIIFLFASVVFVFYLLSMAIRALHMFLLSSISIIILIYISPITIPMVMFKKTKSIFDKWWKNLMGFSLQPFILFAYLGILISIFDATIAGDISYKGDGVTGPKTMECNSQAAKDSVYCIFSQLGIKTNNIEALGIGFPELEILNPGSNTIENIVFVMIKAAFLMFIFGQFFGKITSFAAKLVGGAELKAQGMDVGKALQKGYGALRGAQLRGMRGMKKAARGVGARAMNKRKEIGSAVGTKGKGLSLAKGRSASDSSKAPTGGVGGSPAASKPTKDK